MKKKYAYILLVVLFLLSIVVVLYRSKSKMYKYEVENLQESVTLLNLKITSLNNFNQQLREENERLRDKINYFKNELLDVTKQCWKSLWSTFDKKARKEKRLVSRVNVEDIIQRAVRLNKDGDTCGAIVVLEKAKRFNKSAKIYSQLGWVYRQLKSMIRQRKISPGLLS